MFFVKVEDGKIVQTGSFNFEAPAPDGFEEVTEDIFNQITSLPAEFTRTRGKISSVTCPPIPEPVPEAVKETLTGGNVDERHS